MKNKKDYKEYIEEVTREYGFTDEDLLVMFEGKNKDIYLGTEIEGVYLNPEELAKSEVAEIMREQIPHILAGFIDFKGIGKKMIEEDNNYRYVILNSGDIVSFYI